MEQYHDIMQRILDEGSLVDDRTGVGTRKLFGEQMRFDLSAGFPLITTKKVYLRAIFVELIWLIRGETNIKYLVDRNVRIRNERPFQRYLRENNLEKDFPTYSDERKDKMKWFVDEIKTKDASDPRVVQRGDLGPVYGHQWRNYNGAGVDQLAIAINQIRQQPAGRRIIVNAWNPAQLQDMLLPPCHMFYQFNVDTEHRKLHLQMYQRSCDMFLGVPFNIASYSLLLMLISQITGYETGDFIHTLGDAHIYSNHIDAVQTQLQRDHRPLPELRILKDIKTLADIESMEREDIELLGYDPHPRIAAPVAV